MSLLDEKELTLLALIGGTFILVTLSATIGTIYFAMSVVYALMLMRGKTAVFEFSTGKTQLGRVILNAFLFLGIFLGLASVVLGSFENAISAVTFFASSFLSNFTIDNALVKLAVFGFFIPVVETLFFFGVIYKYILKKASARNTFNDRNTLVAAVMVAGIATSFHFLVRLLNEQALTADLLFFGVSALVVTQYKRLEEAAGLHIAANSLSIAKILGLIRF